ncbi:MAG: site-2 protease family protein [Clostridia bacterium]|nr:site-2 protease family protein [Clostridia bacterium]
MLVDLMTGNYSTEFAVMTFITFTLAYLIALTMHEFSHAYMAVRQGDDTPRLQGRLTVNPFAHMDTMGLLCFLFAGFGWAKPVQINPLKFKRYRSGIAKVSLAGVGMNLILCFVFSALYCLSLKWVGLSTISNYFYLFSYYGMEINAWLIFFNILPIYPLDGFNWLSTKLKPGNKYVDFNYKYGTLILLLLVATSLVTYYVSFCADWLTYPFIRLFSWIFRV